METIKVDLHMHGPIGFQRYWLEKQGYKGKNILNEIADSCFRKGVGLTAITSEEDEIPRGTIHDRFNWLKNNYVCDIKNKGYDFKELGENIGVITREQNKLYLVNAQTVRTDYNGKNIGLVIIGKNDIENHRNFEEVVDELSKREDILFGAGYELFKYKLIDEVVNKINYIEGFNSQMPPWKNWQFQKYADEKKKPWIAVSDAHRIEDAGISYVKLFANNLNFSSEKDLISSLKQNIKSNNFIRGCKYEKISDWINWVSKFRKGLNTKEYKK